MLHPARLFQDRFQNREAYSGEATRLLRAAPDSSALSEIPLPPLPIQEEIVNHINEIKAQIKELRRQALELREQAKKDFEGSVFE